MPNAIYNIFSEYSGSVEQFNKFHNQVINMPRDAFSTATLDKLQSIASYLLLIENTIESNGMSYKDFMMLIIKELKKGKYPKLYRSEEFENRYFNLETNINELYINEGRMFRHLMELCEFFGIVKSISRQKKTIDFDSCNELVLSSSEMLKPIYRNNLLNINIKSNDCIRNLKGIEVLDNADYRPGFAILKFIKQINRPATMFEISILLGRIDESLQSEQEILSRAHEVARNLPLDQDDQIKTFFGSLKWKSSDGNLYEYSTSQQPYFKFQTFFLFMEHLGLITINRVDNTVKITEYSEKLLTAEIPMELFDLESLLSMIDDDSESDALLSDIILRKRSSIITNAIRTDTTLVVKMNKRSLRNIEYNRNGKRKRNRIIIELAKIKANYTCEATDKKTFKMSNGLFYVEAHHIIEFSTEDGPDITDNLLVLGPEKHQLLHHACIEEIDDLYNHLKTNGVINFERFKRMHTIYNCLTKKHIQVLFNKKLISSINRDTLSEIIG